MQEALSGVARLRRWRLLLRRIQQQGVREIRGDIVLGNSAFNVPDVPAGEFDANR